jgi:hypothetical protein
MSTAPAATRVTPDCSPGNSLPGTDRRRWHRRGSSPAIIHDRPRDNHDQLRGHTLDPEWDLAHALLDRSDTGVPVHMSAA